MGWFTGKPSRQDESDRTLALCLQFLDRAGFYTNGPFQIRFFNETKVLNGAGIGSVAVGWGHHTGVRGENGFAGKSGFALEIIHGVPASLEMVSAEAVEVVDVLHGIARFRDTSLIDELKHPDPGLVRRLLSSTDADDQATKLDAHIRYWLHQYYDGEATRSELVDAVVNPLKSSVLQVLKWYDEDLVEPEDLALEIRHALRRIP